jgi:hypothetical protein
MAIGSVHELVYLPGQIIYRYTAIQQIVTTINELESSVMRIFQVRPARATLQAKDRVLTNAVSVMYKSRAPYYRALSGQTMAVPPPSMAKMASLAPSAPQDRVSLSQSAMQGGLERAAMSKLV